MTGETHAARYLIRGGRIYDHDGDIRQPAAADLLIRDGIIERIAPQIAADDGVEVVDAAGKLVAPGFVNAHYHSHDVMAKGLFEEMPFDIWMLHSNPASYGRRSHEEVRVRTLIGAAESLRNGITTIQDFLTVVPPDEAYVDTVLSAYEEAGIRVVFAIAARDRAALDIAPFIPNNLPDSIKKRLAGQDRSARDELDFVSNQIRRLGKTPTKLQTWALAPSAPQRCSAELLEGIAALSREHGLPVLTHVYETRVQAAAAHMGSDPSVSLFDVLAHAGLMNDRLGVVHGVWLSPRNIARSRRPVRASSTIRSAISSSRAGLRRAGSAALRDRARRTARSSATEISHCHRKPPTERRRPRPHMASPASRHPQAATCVDWPCQRLPNRANSFRSPSGRRPRS